MQDIPGLVAILAYDGLCTFEFGIAIEIFALPRPEFDFAWYAHRIVAVDPGPLRATGGFVVSTDAGLEVLGYMNQASFLLGCGIGDLLLRTDPEDAVRYLPQSKAVQKLVSPAEMGELFKVLAVGREVELPEAIVRADRSHRL